MDIEDRTRIRINNKVGKKKKLNSFLHLVMRFFFNWRKFILGGVCGYVLVETIEAIINYALKQ